MTRRQGLLQLRGRAQAGPSSSGHFSGSASFRAVAIESTCIQNRNVTSCPSHPTGKGPTERAGLSHNEEAENSTSTALVRFAIELETTAVDLEGDATHNERRRAGWLVAQVCDLYSDSAEEARAEVRRVLLRRELLRVLFCSEIARAAAELGRDPSPRRLRSGLVAAVLADRRPDERVWDIRLQALSAVRGIPSVVVDGLWQEACDLATQPETRRALHAVDQLRRRSQIARISGAQGLGNARGS